MQIAMEIIYHDLNSEVNATVTRPIQELKKKGRLNHRIPLEK